MSGYLEVKYPFKSSLGLNPFKTWKRQWCILRPSSTCFGGASLAVYCSEAGASAGAVQLPPDSVIRRAKSRSRPHAFAVFSALEPHKPRILLAAQTYQDAQLWMEKIRTLLDDKKLFGTESFKDSYSVTIITSELSRKLCLSGDGLLTLSKDGVLISRSQKLETLIEWKHVKEATHITDPDKNKICVLNVHSGFHYGGSLKLSTPLAAELAAALTPGVEGRVRKSKRLSQSEGDLRPAACDGDPGAPTGDTRRSRLSSWPNSGPSEVTLDDTALLMLKERRRTPPTPRPLSRCAGAGHLPRQHGAPERLSLLSVASGVYEEIPDPPEQLYTLMSRTRRAAESAPESEEPAYESVAECVAGSARRDPPPLPPRLPFGTAKLGASWNSRVNAPPAEGVTRHGSLGALPRCAPPHPRAPHPRSSTLPKPARQPFSVFRKRLKSDSRIASPKSDTAKENKDVETKKKKFDFTPTRELFKSFKVSRKMRNLKIAGGLNKAGETKSCEFLDDTEHVTAARCSKSVECLEESDQFIDEFDGNLSLEFNDDAVTRLAVPQEIVELVLRAEHLSKIRLRAQLTESDYMPMSPIIPPAPVEHHYIAMSPRTNIV